MRSLKDKVAVITGASSGIGRQIAFRLAEKGMRMCLLGRNVSHLQEVTDQAKKASPQALFYAVDLSSEPDIRQVCEAIGRDFGKVDVLVHSAGIIALGPLETASVADFDRQYQINVRAPFILTQALLPMLKASQGHIIFINSSSGQSASANNGLYAATKFALKGIADSFRLALNAYGLRVLTIYPGRTASPMQEAVFKMEGRDYHPERLMQPEDVAEIILTAIALPRSAEITDISVRPLTKTI